MLQDIQEPTDFSDGLEASWRQWNATALHEGEEAWVRIRGLEAHFEHKSLWSTVLIFTIAWMVIFESILVACVGFGWWDFKEYAWLVPTLMIQFLAQIVGLGILVVKSLFKDMA